MKKEYVRNVFWMNENVVHIKIHDIILLKQELHSMKQDGTQFVISIFADSMKDCQSKIYSFEIDLSNISIAVVEKETQLLTKLVQFFYTTSLRQPQSCILKNPPSSFSFIWDMIQPLLSTDAKNKITIENKVAQILKVK